MSGCALGRFNLAVAMTGHQQGARVNEILFWMIGVENAAANLYSEAAVCFSDDKQLSGFLHHLAAEEREHLKLLGKTMESLPIARLSPAAIYFDDEFRRKIDQPIISAQNALDRGELKSSDIIDVIAEIEFSEWNEAFIYTISASKGLGEDFEKAAAKIDQHRIGIKISFQIFRRGKVFCRGFAGSVSKPKIGF